MLYVVSAVISFCSVFLKGFQIKNVQFNQYKLIAVTSYLIAFFEVATVTIIVKGGWLVALSAGTGATAGILLSVYLHKRIFKK